MWGNASRTAPHPGIRSPRAAFRIAPAASATHYVIVQHQMVELTASSAWLSAILAPCTSTEPKYPEKSLPDSRSWAIWGSTSGTAVTRGSGRLSRPRPDRLEPTCTDEAALWGTIFTEGRNRSTAESIRVRNEIMGSVQRTGRSVVLQLAYGVG